MKNKIFGASGFASVEFEDVSIVSEPIIVAQF